MKKLPFLILFLIFCALAQEIRAGTFLQQVAPDSIEQDNYDVYQSKELLRSQWYTQNRFGDYKSFNAQYRIQAFKVLHNTKLRAERERKWESLGPHNISGRLLSMAVHPENEEIMWVGSANGGVWKTENGGKNWSHLTSDLPAMAIYGVAVHPKNPDLMLIGTGTAAGVATALGANTVAARGAGVFVSNNGGLNWTEAGQKVRPTNTDNHLSNTNQLTWSSSSGDTLYMASDYGLWQYDVRKNEWAPAFSGAHAAHMKSNVLSVVVNKKNPRFITAALQHHGVLRSEDAGKTWQFMNKGLLSFQDSTNQVKKLIQHSSNPNVMYLSLITSADNRALRKMWIFKTTDHGLNWNLTKETPQFVQQIAVSPEDPDLLIAGGVKLFRSVNGGKGWKDVTLQQHCFDVVHVDQKGIFFSEKNPDTIYLLNDGGFYISRNRGDCWQAFNQGLNTLQVYGISSSPHDPSIISAGAQDQGTLITYDNGETWTKWVSGDGGKTHFDSENDDILYATAQFGNPWKLVKGKEKRRLRIDTSRQRNDRTTSLFVPPFEMSPEDPKRLYTATRTHIYRSIDGGESWIKSDIEIPDINIITVDVKNPDNVFAYSTTGILYRSMDAGSTWDIPECGDEESCNTPGTQVSDLKTDPEDEGVLYATKSTIDDDQVWISVDEGTSWHPFLRTLTYGDGASCPVQSIAITPRSITGTKHIYVGTDMGVFMMCEGEESWRYMWGKDAPSAIVTQLEIQPEDRSLLVGTYGQGIWKLTISTDDMPDECTMPRLVR